MRGRPLIWDLPTRLVHWLLVVCVIAAWATAEGGVEYRAYHMQIGYLILGLILFRVLWGFAGTRYARFDSFLAGPRAVAAALRQLGQRDTPAPTGHGVLGGLSTLALLALLALQAGTGLFADDDVLHSGPYAASVSGAWVERITDWHHLIFDGLSLVIGLHLAAIAFYRFYKNQHLVGSMIHGRKAVAPDAGITGSALGRALLLGLIAGGLIYALVTLAPAPVVNLEDFY